MAGVKIIHVPYKGSSGARTDVLGGQVHMMFDAITTMAPTGAGKLKALATTGKTRSSVTPDLPTVAEAGVPRYEATIWLGIMAPMGTPRPIVEQLNAEIRKIVNAPTSRTPGPSRAPSSMSMPRSSSSTCGRHRQVGNIVKISGAKPD